MPHVSLTRGLILLNVLVFFIIKGLDTYQVNMRFIAIPGSLTPGLLLSNFSHIGGLHLLSNMYLLYILGPIIESFVGRKNFGLLVLFTMICTSFGGYYLYGGPTLGFSGIALGMVGYAYFSRSVLINKQQLLPLLLINIAIGLAPGISFWGHALGAAAGTLYAKVDDFSD